MGVILTTYIHWDDPPSRGPLTPKFQSRMDPFKVSYLRTVGACPFTRRSCEAPGGFFLNNKREEDGGVATKITFVYQNSILDIYIYIDI